VLAIADTLSQDWSIGFASFIATEFVLVAVMSFADVMGGKNSSGRAIYMTGLLMTWV
jgi:hypothetical protein